MTLGGHLDRLPETAADRLTWKQSALSASMHGIRYWPTRQCNAYNTVQYRAFKISGTRCLAVQIGSPTIEKDLDSVSYIGTVPVLYVFDDRKISF